MDNQDIFNKIPSCSEEYKKNLNFEEEYKKNSTNFQRNCFNFEK